MLTTIANNAVANIAKAIWQGGDFFPLHMPTVQCQPYLLRLSFLCALSSMPISLHNAWQRCGLLVALEAQMDVLFASRAQAGNGARIDKALNALTLLNPAQLGLHLTMHPFDSLLDSEEERDELLCALLCHFEQVDVLVSNVAPSQRTPQLWGEIFSEVLRLFACHHSASTHFIVSTKESQAYSSHVTPPPVAHLMVRLLDPRPQDSIYDPLCGVGNVLLNCAQWITQVHSGKPQILYGQTLNPEQAAIARMHLTLYGVDSTHILCTSDDAQNTQSPSSFDVVLSAPSLSLYLAAHSADNHANQCNDSGVGLGLALAMLARLQPETGRMAILLPLAALTRSDQREMRKELVLANAIESIILLPPCLLPHYPAAAAVVFMRRDADKSPVYLVDARALMATSQESNEQVMACIEQAFLPKRERAGLSRWISNDELDAAKYDFTVHIAPHNNFSQRLNLDEGGIFIIHPHDALQHHEAKLLDDNADLLCIE